MILPSSACLVCVADNPPLQAYLAPAGCPDGRHVQRSPVLHASPGLLPAKAPPRRCRLCGDAGWL